MPKTLLTAMACSALLLSAGCATPGSHEHPELMSRIQAAEKAAAEAQQSAARAQTRADEAASQALANSEKIDRAFRKSQQK